MASAAAGRPTVRPAVLWIGGASAVAATFFEEFVSAAAAAPAALTEQARGIIWIVPAPELPSDMTLPTGVSFVALDLREEASVRTVFDRCVLPHQFPPEPPRPRTHSPLRTVRSWTPFCSARVACRVASRPSFWACGSL
eukprot:scaffold16763_cov117-Isochrysis_galbana.AAC.1